jgi:hypothetical protein
MSNDLTPVERRLLESIDRGEVGIRGDILTAIATYDESSDWSHGLPDVLADQWNQLSLQSKLTALIVAQYYKSQPAWWWDALEG